MPNPPTQNTTFAARRAEREALEAEHGKPERRHSGTIRAGHSAPQPVIVVTRA